MGYHGSYDVTAILTLSGQQLEIPAVVTRYDGVVPSNSGDEKTSAARAQVETARGEGKTVIVKNVIFQSEKDERAWKATRVQGPIRFHIL